MIVQDGVTKLKFSGSGSVPGLQDIIKAAGLKNDTISVRSIATMSKCNHFFKNSGAFCELK